MDKQTQLNAYFRLSSLITDLFPSGGARFLDFFVQRTLGNRVVAGTVKHGARKSLSKARKFRSFLVVGDLNIGDAIIGEGVVYALRQSFPSARIDYVVKKVTEDLLDGNPDVTDLFPVYVGAPFPEDSDIEELTRITRAREYDVIINLSPMIDNRIFGQKSVLNYTMIASELIRNEGSGNSVNNIVYQAYRFVADAFRAHVPLDPGDKFKGSRVYLSRNAIETAESFLTAHGIDPWSPIVFVNPDASARFTRVPFDIQRNLLKWISTQECTILLGAGHVERYIEHELAYSLSAAERNKIIFVPASFKIDAYTALIDRADVFITGDTGPLHLAAARKYSRESGKDLTNKTAVFSIFGGTPPTIYGYDSVASGFFPANQDAPSRTFVGNAPCRNITCINKMAKTCKEVRCFQELDVKEIYREISSHLQVSRKRYAREVGIFAK